MSALQTIGFIVVTLLTGYGLGKFLVWRYESDHAVTVTHLDSKQYAKMDAALEQVRASRKDWEEDPLHLLGYPRPYGYGPAKEDRKQVDQDLSRLDRWDGVGTR